MGDAFLMKVTGLWSSRPAPTEGEGLAVREAEEPVLAEGLLATMSALIATRLVIGQPTVARQCLKERKTSVMVAALIVAEGVTSDAIVMSAVNAVVAPGHTHPGQAATLAQSQDRLRPVADTPDQDPLHENATAADPTHLARIPPTVTAAREGTEKKRPVTEVETSVRLLLVDQKAAAAPKTHLNRKVLRLTRAVDPSLYQKTPVRTPTKCENLRSLAHTRIYLNNSFELFCLQSASCSSFALSQLRRFSKLDLF